MTIRPIFRPSARVKVREPDSVGAAGWMARGNIRRRRGLRFFLVDFLLACRMDGGC